MTTGIRDWEIDSLPSQPSRRRGVVKIFSFFESGPVVLRQFQIFGSEFLGSRLCSRLVFTLKLVRSDKKVNWPDDDLRTCQVHMGQACNRWKWLILFRRSRTGQSLRKEKVMLPTAYSIIFYLSWIRAFSPFDPCFYPEEFDFSNFFVVFMTPR